MTDGSQSDEGGMELARENLDVCRDVADSDLPLAPFADLLVSAIEEEYEDV